MCALEMCECFFVKQRTASEWRIRGWSSDVCSSVLGPAAQAARAVQFVADQDGTVEELFFFLAEQEAGSPRDRGAADRAEQVTEQAGTDARVEDEGQLADRRLAGGEAFDRPGAGPRAQGLSPFEFWPGLRAVPGIVALH